MGIALTLCTYLIMLVFLGVSGSRFLTLWKASIAMRTAMPKKPPDPLVVLKGIGDIILLTRLMEANDLLWLAEWTFHFSFVVVVIRHLRYILNPVPDWVWYFQTPGLIAGYILPVSLLCILAIKLRGKEYLPSYNLFLLVLLFLIGISGLLLKTVFHSDVVAVKNFMLGIFTFSPRDQQLSLLFAVHYLLVLVLFASLPSHIFTAPFVIMEARIRDEGLEAVVHEKR